MSLGFQWYSAGTSERGVDGAEELNQVLSGYYTALVDTVLDSGGDVIAFVEVKARASEQAALDSVTFKARQRISKTALWWIARQKDHAKLSWRFDVVAVMPRQWPKHHQRVWE